MQQSYSVKQRPCRWSLVWGLNCHLFSALLAIAFIAVVSHTGASHTLFAQQEIRTEPAVSQSADDSASLNVMSFNLRYGSANDGENRWEKRTQLVREAIKRNDPDLLGTQETLPFQAEFISENFSQFERIGRSRLPDNNNGEQCALFYRKSRFDKLAEGHFWLSEAPDLAGSKSWDSSLPRMATWVRLWDRKAERAILFLNTHFDHRGETARQESAALIRKKVSVLADGAAIVITGDFNAGVDSVAHQRLANADDSVSLVDCYSKIHETEPEMSGTFNGFSGKQDGARIDWIVVDESLLSVSESKIETYHESGRYPSDHFPVTAELHWK